MPTPQAETPTDAATPGGREISLKEAERLSGRSERTLRRKLETGELLGRKIQLEYGGAAWMVDLHSLVGLYPELEPAADVPQGGGGTPGPDLTEKPAGTESAGAATGGGTGRQMPPPPDGEEDAEAAPSPAAFFGYLYQENKTLRKRVTSLQDDLMEARYQTGKAEGEAAAAERYKQQVLQSLENLQGQHIETVARLQETTARLQLLERNPGPSEQVIDAEVITREDRPPQPAIPAAGSKIGAPATSFAILVLVAIIVWLAHSNHFF